MSNPKTKNTSMPPSATEVKPAKWRQLWHSWLLSLQFLTSLPVHRFFRQANAIPSSWSLGQTLYFYPLVGLKIGSILWLSAWMLQIVFMQETVLYHAQISAGVLLMLWVLLTGGLHLDGLADSADAWMGGLGDREKTLAIMKDPACGAMAVITLILVLLLKWLLLTQVLLSGHEDVLIMGLIIVPVLARLGVVVLVIYTPYQRAQGLGSELKQHSRSFWLWVQCIFVVAVAAFLQWWAVLGTMLVALCFGWFLRRIMMVRLGGWTGDTAGALIELIELVALLGVVAFVAH